MVAAIGDVAMVEVPGEVATMVAAIGDVAMVEVPGEVATMVAAIGDVAMVEVPGGVATMVAAVELGIRYSILYTCSYTCKQGVHVASVSKCDKQSAGTYTLYWEGILHPCLGQHVNTLPVPWFHHLKVLIHACVLVLTLDDVAVAK